MPGETAKNGARGLRLYRGTAPVLRFTISGATTSDPASGWSTKWTLRSTDESANYTLQVSGAWNATDATIDVSLTRAQTLALVAGKYVASLFRTNTGSEDILAKDEVTVEEGIYDGQ